MRESFGIRIDSDPVARLWTGFGNLIVPADIVESAPAIYLGGGELLTAPDFEVPINGTAERLDIQLSGVSADVMAIALEEAASVKGAKVHFVRFYFDDEWQLEDVEYDAVFRADKLTVNSDDAERGRTRTLTLSIATEDTNRNRSPQAFFTDQDQRRRSPTDAIFSHVSQITQGVMRRFGPR
jgi:hypothetical protein